MIWARSIENLAIVVTTQNLFSADQRGMAMVATPEEIIFESTTAGLYVVDVDLERVRELRNKDDDITSVQHEAAKAGVLTQWQRPELYDTYHPRPAADDLPDAATGDD